MTGSIKSAASHPGSLWITMLAAIGAALAGYTQNTEVVRSVDAFCHASENSSYQALVDLREKVDWIHSRVTANEEKLAFATSPLVVRLSRSRQTPPGRMRVSLSLWMRRKWHPLRRKLRKRR